LRRPPAGAGPPGRGERGGRLRPAARRWLLGLPVGRGGGRCRAGHHRRGPRRRPARLHRAPDPAAARARAADPALPAPAAAAGRKRRQAVQVQCRAAAGSVRSAAAAAPVLGAAGAGPGAAAPGRQRGRTAAPCRCTFRSGTDTGALALSWGRHYNCLTFAHPQGGTHMSSRVALVTDGTGGIGTSICKRLADMGHRVATNYRNEEKTLAWQRKMQEAGYDITIDPGDVGSPEAAQALVRGVEEKLGPVEILVNNAGITRDTTFLRMTPEQWHEVINTNLNSVFNVTRPVIEGMRERKWGR